MMHLVKCIVGDKQLLLGFMESALCRFISGDQLASLRRFSVQVRCDTVALALQCRELLFMVLLLICL